MNTLALAYLGHQRHHGWMGTSNNPSISGAGSLFGCPQCMAPTRVIDTRQTPTEIVRKRECKGPEKHVYNTFELPKGGWTVRRSTGEVENLDRDKLERSIKLACVTLPPSVIRDYTDDVLERLKKAFPDGREIPTLRVGETVLDKLRVAMPAAAARYAMTFYTRRPEKEIQVTSVDQLITRIFPNESEHPRPDGPIRPEVVSKKPQPAQTGRYAIAEEFRYEKLWKSLARATRGRVVPARSADLSTGAVRHDDTILPIPSHLDYWQGYRYFVNVVTAYVVDQVSGVKNVTSGRLSSACVDALCEVHPLGAARYSTASKTFEGGRTSDYLLAELRWVGDRHHALAEDSMQADLSARWGAFAKSNSELIDLIEAKVVGIPL